MSRRIHICAIWPLLVLATIAGCTWRGGAKEREIEKSSCWVTKLSTLIPRYLEETTKLHATVPHSGEEELVIDDLDQTIYRYHYPAP